MFKLLDFFLKRLIYLVMAPCSQDYGRLKSGAWSPVFQNPWDLSHHRVLPGCVSMELG